MTPSIMFVYGFVGAFVVDFEKLYLEVTERKPRVVGFPKAYRQPEFWVLRVLHSIGGGFLAAAWGESFAQQTPLTLMAVGGAAGLIVDRFGQLIAQKIGGEIYADTKEEPRIDSRRQH